MADRWLPGPGAFRRLFATRLVSQFGDGLFQASLASAVFFSPERQTDAAAVAVGFGVLLLPYSLIGPFAGVFLDRWSRARILVRSALVRSVLVVGTAAVLASMGISGPAFILLALAVISVNRFFLSALSAALPRVVGPDRLAGANALSVTAGTVATIVGAGAGVLLRGNGSDRALAGVALTAAVAYAVSAAVAAGFPSARLGPAPEGSAAPPSVPALGAELRAVALGLAAGARHVARRRPAAAALAVMTAHRLLFGVTSLLTLLAYRNTFTDSGVFRAGLAGLGQVVAASGVGTLLGALATPPVVRRMRKPRWVAVVLMLAAAAEVGCGLPYTPASFLAAGLVLGFVSQAVKICVDTTVQESVDDGFRGRVFSVYDTLFNVSFVAAAAVGAAVLPAGGVSRPAIIALAAAYALTALGYLLAAGAGTPGRGPLSSERSPARSPTPAAGAQPRPGPAAPPPGGVP